MAGTPRSTGCVNCHKRKRKCDEAKPSCASCRRLGVKCVGNGAKRWKFISEVANESSQVVHARTIVPTNETTNLAARLVHILENQDVRYDIRAFGEGLMSELPLQLGTSPELDTAISAVVAVYNSRQNGIPKNEALNGYGKALTATRRAVENCTQAPMLAIKTMIMVSICQTLIDRKNVQNHRITMVHVFQHAVLQGWISKIDRSEIYLLLQIALWTSLVEPGTILGSWFWEAYGVVCPARPQNYQPDSFVSLEMDTIACVSIQINSQSPDIPGLRRIHDLLQAEKLHIRYLTTAISSAGPTHTRATEDRRLLASYAFSWAMILTLESLVNRTLRNFDDDPELLIAAKDSYFEALDLASQCQILRPFGSGFLPEKLKVVWAATSDILDATELKHVLVDYETDIEGADFIGDAERLRQRLRALSKRQIESVRAGNITTGNMKLSLSD